MLNVKLVVRIVTRYRQMASWSRRSSRFTADTFTGLNFILSHRSPSPFCSRFQTQRLQCIAGRTIQIFMKSTFFHFYITSFQYKSIALSEIDSTKLYRTGHGCYDLSSAFFILASKGYIRNYVGKEAVLLLSGVYRVFSYTGSRVDRNIQSHYVT